MGEANGARSPRPHAPSPSSTPSEGFQEPAPAKAGGSRLAGFPMVPWGAAPLGGVRGEAPACFCFSRLPWSGPGGLPRRAPNAALAAPARSVPRPDRILAGYCACECILHGWRRETRPGITGAGGALRPHPATLCESRGETVPGLVAPPSRRRRLPRQSERRWRPCRTTPKFLAVPPSPPPAQAARRRCQPMAGIRAGTAPGLVAPPSAGAGLTGRCLPCCQSRS